MMYYTVICTVNTVLKELGIVDGALWVIIREGGSSPLHDVILYRLFPEAHRGCMHAAAFSAVQFDYWKTVFDFKMMKPICKKIFHSFRFYCISKFSSIDGTFS